MILPSTHRHITEREMAHRWPDGQWDNAAWEDCTFVSGVELARVCWDADIPATHAEAEALRDDAGEPPLGGTNIGDIIRGFKARYGWGVYTYIATGFSSLWSVLQPGRAAVVQGSMGAFIDGSYWRRHDPGFAGAHATFVMRLDSSDRVWWCDPLAPQNGKYQGEWMTKAALKLYVDAFRGASLVAAIKTDTEKKVLNFKFISDAKGRATIQGSDHSAILIDGTLFKLPDQASKDVFAKIEFIDGPWKGLRAFIVGDNAAFLLERDVSFKAWVDPTPYSKADLDAAIVADRSKARIIYS